VTYLNIKEGIQPLQLSEYNKKRKAKAMALDFAVAQGMVTENIAERKCARVRASRSREAAPSTRPHLRPHRPQRQLYDNLCLCTVCRCFNLYWNGSITASGTPAPTFTSETDVPFDVSTARPTTTIMGYKLCEPFKQLQIQAAAANLPLFIRNGDPLKPDATVLKSAMEVAYVEIKAPRTHALSYKVKLFKMEYVAVLNVWTEVASDHAGQHQRRTLHADPSSSLPEELLPDDARPQPVNVTPSKRPFFTAHRSPRASTGQADERVASNGSRKGTAARFPFTPVIRISFLNQQAVFDEVQENVVHLGVLVTVNQFENHGQWIDKLFSLDTLENEAWK
ncbi:hypothetical protein BGZ65_000397, partial [Modicella reniformis]